VLFITSFALSGLGMFLLVRDLLSDQAEDAPHDSGLAVSLAAFLAGLIFAFIPFRIAQVAHIQSLHAQWMPLALFGFRRFIVSLRWRALAGGSAALLMQNWSNGYYLFYFAPMVLIFIVHQLWIARRLRDSRAWLGLAAAAAVVIFGTLPFLLLYLETQRVHGFERPLAEVVAYSADVYSYFSAPEALRVWGDVMRAFPKAEGELFFGLVPWSMFFLAVVHAVRHVFRRGAVTQPDTPASRSPDNKRHVAVVILRTIIVVQTLGIIGIVLTGGFVSSVAGIPVRATNSSRLMVTIAVAATVLLVLSRAARQRALIAARSPLTLCIALVVLALWLSLGPLPQSRGRLLPGLGLYALLYEHVPGFAGLRVPARYAMIAAVFMAVACGFAALALFRRGRVIAIASLLAVLFLVDVWFAPMPINLTWGSSYVDAPPRVFPRADAPPVYHAVANLDDDTVVAEFPFGDTTWELRYVYYSTVHWKRLLNGYSGGFPQQYQARVAVLRRVREDPEGAWRALRDAGTTHVIVHERAFHDDEGAVISKWLNDHFAVEIARFEGDLLFDVSGVWPPR
jgi:hypothetical protein